MFCYDYCIINFHVLCRIKNKISHCNIVYKLLRNTNLCNTIRHWRPQKFLKGGGQPPKKTHSEKGLHKEKKAPHREEMSFITRRKAPTR